MWALNPSAWEVDIRSKEGVEQDMRRSRGLVVIIALLIEIVSIRDLQSLQHRLPRHGYCQTEIEDTETDIDANEYGGSGVIWVNIAEPDGFDCDDCEVESVDEGEVEEGVYECAEGDVGDEDDDDDDEGALTAGET
jgi:hypothetical protein